MIGSLKIGAVVPALTNVENLKGTVIMIMSALEFLHAGPIIASITFPLMLIAAIILAQVRN